MRLILLAPVFLFLSVPSCGATPGQREAYALETARCIANERAIVERDSGPEQDEIDLAIERARCDAALARARASGSGGGQ